MCLQFFIRLASILKSETYLHEIFTCSAIICQGFAFGSAALVSLALFGAVVSRAGI